MDAVNSSSAQLDDSLSSPLPAERRSAFRAVPWQWRDVLIGLAPILALRAASELIPRDTTSGVLRWLALSASALVSVWLLVFPLWVARRRQAPLPRVPRPRRLAIEAALAVPTLFGVWLSLGVLVAVWQAVAGAVPKLENPLLEPARSGNRVLVLAVMAWAVTVAPVAEEVFCRGMLYNALRQRFPWPVAAVLQALVFGFMHTFGIVHALAASFLGLAFALVYDWRKTLLAPVFLHILQNFAAAVATLAAAAMFADEPVLGITGTPDAGGYRITAVQAGSGADDAGLREGDVITSVDHRPVEDVPDIASAIRGKRVGDRILVEFLRDGVPQRVEPKLTRRGP